LIDNKSGENQLANQVVSARAVAQIAETADAETPASGDATAEEQTNEDDNNE